MRSSKRYGKAQTMSEYKEHNAIIQSVSISTERTLSAWLYLDYGGSGQGFGGYCLYNNSKTGKKDHGNYAGLFIQRCIEIGGVEEWEKLPGKCIRVRSSHTGVEAIGHIVKDDWFTPKEEFEAYRERMAQ